MREDKPGSTDVPKAADEGAPFAIVSDDSRADIGRGREQAAEPLWSVLETEDETPITPALEAAALPPPRRPIPQHRWGVGKYALGSLGILVVVYVAGSVLEWLRDEVGRGAVLGYLVAPFVCAAVVSSVWWLWSEISAWRRLIVADRLRGALSGAGQGELERSRFVSAVRDLRSTMQGSQQEAVATFLKGIGGNRSADELSVIFEHDVVRPMDEEALHAIHHSVYDGFFLGLISPTPVTDTAVFVVRAVGMIQAVACAYGHRPGRLGLYRLIRHILADVALLSAVMILMSRGSASVGRTIGGLARTVPALAATSGEPFSTVAGVVVGVAGAAVGTAMEAAGEEVSDAVAAAVRMAHLGLLAIAVSRPIALSDKRKTELSSHLRKMILSFRRAGGRGQGLHPAAGRT